MYKFLISVIFTSLALVPVSSHAQTEAFGGEFAFNAALKSDYRFRGVSRSNNDIAVQGGVDWYADNGIYAGAFASSVSDFRGSDVETNLYLGYGVESNGLIYDVGVTAYIFPGGTNSTYLETFGSVGVDFGLLTSSVGLSYMPSQSNNGDQDNIYFFTDTRAEIPDSPFAVDVHLGYEDGVFGNSKWDWKIGGSVSFEQFELGIAYVDTNVVGRRSDSGVVFSVGAYF